MVRELILLVLGAAFGLGTTLVSQSAPIYIPNAPAWVWHWAFWVGIVIISLMILDLILLLTWSEKSPRVAPALLMNMGVFLFAAGLIWHHQPGAPEKTSQQVDRKLSKSTAPDLHGTIEQFFAGGQNPNLPKEVTVTFLMTIVNRGERPSIAANWRVLGTRGKSVSRKGHGL